MRLPPAHSSPGAGPTRVVGPARSAFGQEILVFRQPELFCVPLGPWWWLLGLFGLIPGPTRVLYERLLSRKTQSLLRRPSERLRKALGVRVYGAHDISEVKVALSQRWLRVVVAGRPLRLRSPLSSPSAGRAALESFLGSRRGLIQQQEGWAPPRVLMWVVLALVGLWLYRWFETEGYVELDWFWRLIDR